MTRVASPNPKVVGARELKTRLGKYLRAVAGGATLTVTERGRPVARLTPIPREEATAGEEALEELAALGAISRASGEPFPSVRAIHARGEPIDRTVSRLREDRF